MRIKIIFNLEEGTVFPFNYKEYIQGIIYDHLSPELARKLHDYSKYKPVNFGRIYGNYEISSDGLIAKGDLFLFISSLEESIVEDIYNNIMDKGYFYIGKNKALAKGIDIIYTPYVYGRDIKLRSMSEITCYKKDELGKMAFLDSNNPEYNDYLITQIVNKARFFNITGDINKFEIIKSEKQGVYAYKKTFYKCEFLSFVFNGDYAILDLILSVGIGQKNGCGFGMVEIEYEN